jgi:hypothetical protein
MEKAFHSRNHITKSGRVANFSNAQISMKIQKTYNGTNTNLKELIKSPETEPKEKEISELPKD